MIMGCFPELEGAAMASKRWWATVLLAGLLFCEGKSAGGAAVTGGTPPAWTHEVVSSQVLKVGGATLQLDFAAGALDLPHDQVVHWVETAARAVSTYYRRFPVAKARILVVPVAGRRDVLGGTTWGHVGGFPAFTRIELGEHTQQQDLTEDWRMTHELVHMAFPSVADEQHWLEEGIATYVEPVARVQIGTLTQAKVWGDMMRDMPNGEPAASSAGLDRTHTWGSTYWGGAMFCLVADVRIREQTGNRKGLQDALRGIVAAGGTIDQEWPVERALGRGDAATGTTVLSDLYKQMGQARMQVDLNALWSELGVGLRQGQVTLDQRAPKARIREAIMAVKQDGV
jgi:hypothetical protein